MFTDQSGNTIKEKLDAYYATPETAQSVLDNLPSGMTVYFGAGEYGDLSIRPTAETIQWPAYYDSNQEIGKPVVNEANEIETDPSKLHDYLLPANVGGFHYIRNLDDTTLIGMDGAVINGCLSILSGHSQNTDDPVRECSTSDSTYESWFSHLRIDGLTIKDITFNTKGNADKGDKFALRFESSTNAEEDIVKNVTIENCEFTNDHTSSNFESPQEHAIRVLTGKHHRYDNFTIRNNTFTGYSIGVYGLIKNSTIEGNTFKDMQRNAIQSSANWSGGSVTNPLVNSLIIRNNTIDGTGKTSIKIQSVDTNATVTMENNNFSEAGTKDTGDNYKIFEIDYDSSNNYNSVNLSFKNNKYNGSSIEDKKITTVTENNNVYLVPEGLRDFE